MLVLQVVVLEVQGFVFGPFGLKRSCWITVVLGLCRCPKP